jgi:S1-C subfamily serine protease
MRVHFSLAHRVLIVSAISLALGAGVGFAQPKAERPAQPSAAATGPKTQTAATQPGVLVTEVQPGSPAEKAGITRGDIILEVGGTAVNTLPALQQVIDTHKPGDVLAMKVSHGDAQKTVNVTLADQNGRPWIGVALYAQGRGMRGEYGRGMRTGPIAGAFVQSLVAGGPAEKAGIQQGDVILSVDGTKVDAQNTLGSLIGAKKVGDTVTLSVQSIAQGGPQVAPRDVKVTLVKSPDKDTPYIGVQYTMAPPRLGGMMRGPAGMAGVFVSEVAGDSPASKAGIQTRDLITKVEGAAVTDPGQVADAVSKHKPGDTLAVTVFRMGDGAVKDLTVTLGQSPADATKAYMGISMGPAGFPGPGAMRRFGGNPPAPAAAPAGQPAQGAGT